MNPIERWAGRLLRAVAYVVAAASGVYLLLYLSRWEWNRAIIAGLFFVAAEVALMAAAILRRLRRLERAVGTRPDTGDPEPPAAHLDRHPFAWLQDAATGEHVFIPILLGLGVVVSAIAWLIERLAAATWSLGGDTAATRRLGWMATSHGGLLSAGRDGATGPAAVDLRPLRPRRPSTAQRVLPPLVLLALLAGVVAVLARFTMYAPSPPIERGQTSYELMVRSRSGAVPDPELVETLWRTCRVHVPGRSASIAPLGEGRFRLTVTPAIGRQDDLRFSGCLADLRFDFVITDVLARDGVVAAAPVAPRSRSA